jgi:hypothetical protein
MLARMTRALVRRAGEGELEALEALRELRDAMPELTASAILAAHQGPGQYSYGEIGRWLGMTRQAARELAERAAASGPGSAPGR